jgi:hypothetical protein
MSIADTAQRFIFIVPLHLSFGRLPMIGGLNRHRSPKSGIFLSEDTH